MSLLFRPDRPLARWLAERAEGPTESAVEHAGCLGLPPHRTTASSWARTDESGRSDACAHPRDRAAVVRDAVRATIADDPLELSSIFCDDVTGSAPTITVFSREELERVCERGDDALDLVELSIDPVDVIGNRAIAEWRITAVFQRPFLLGDDRLVEPTGRLVRLSAVTVASFDGERIRSFRHYLDDAALFEQVLSLG